MNKGKSVRDIFGRLKIFPKTAMNIRIMKRKSFLSLLIITLLIFSCASNSERKSRIENHSTISVDTNGKSVNENYSPQGNKKSTTLKIVTWNIQNLGKSKDSVEILQIAKIIKNNDIVAIQEVVAKDPRGAQAVAKIADELNRMGSKWDYSISDPTKSPSSNISERYAFLWKTSKVRLVKKPFLDKKLESLCYREPYIAEFKLNKGKESFFIINFHSRKYYDNPEEEIIFFKEYPKRLKSERIFIVGDFNLDEKHPVWDNLYQLGFETALKESPTTLKTKCKNGNYLNHSVDNIYYLGTKIEMTQSNRIDFIGDCENLEKARFLSDHLPVQMECIIK